MKTTLKKKHKYSWIQYFFWILSGAEISILKDCPTDYNRQAGIGFTIFMTTLLAFCSGSYAGFYFGEQNYTTAIVFGTIWACLIFSIDRSMVVTLKKDPTKERQNFWPAFLSRAVLAILIAFIISIPLELLIFKDNIDIHKPKFKQDKILDIKRGQGEIQGIDGLKEHGQQVRDNIEKLDQELNQEEPRNDPKYNQIKSDWLVLQRQHNDLLAKKNQAQRQAHEAYNIVPSNINGEKDLSSNEWARYVRLKALSDEANAKFNEFDSEGLESLKTKKAGYISSWKGRLIGEKNRQDSIRNATDNEVDSARRRVEGATQEIDSLLKKHDNSFVFNFMVLEDLARRYRKVWKPETDANSSQQQNGSPNNPFSSDINDTVSNSMNVVKMKEVTEYDPEGSTIFFLLWLVRLIFFTIEILPTIAKISTPVGAYDRAIYQKEKDLKLELEERTSDYLKQQQALRKIEFESEQDQIKERVQIESKLHKELLIAIAQAQNSVAKQRIEEFKVKHSS